MRRIVLLLGICVGLAVAADHPIWQNLRARYLGLKTLSGLFTENISPAKEGARLTFEGAFAISVPARYRIEATGKFKQFLLSDGTTDWIYLPKLKRVIERPTGGFTPILAFLEPILNSGANVEVSKDSTGIYVVSVLMVDKMPVMNDLVLELNEAGTQINSFYFTDSTGGKIRFDFYNQEWNPELSPTLFEFTPPKGARIQKN